MELSHTNPTDGILVHIGVQRPKRFKAGAESGGSVCLHVDISETETAQAYSCQLTVRIGDLSARTCPQR